MFNTKLSKSSDYASILKTNPNILTRLCIFKFQNLIEKSFYISHGIVFKIFHFSSFFFWIVEIRFLINSFYHLNIGYMLRILM